MNSIKILDNIFPSSRDLLAHASHTVIMARNIKNIISKAQNRNVKSQTLLGHAYRNGDNVRQDDIESVR